MRRLCVLLLALGACGAPAPSATSDATRTSRKQEPLGRLMKEQVNPSFSRLTFLVFHGEDMDDPDAVQAELVRAANVLQGAMAKLHAWPTPPTITDEGRDVFYAYAASVDRASQRLVQSIAARDSDALPAHLESIARTCNDCHHFFRLDIKDSVVGPSAAP